MGNYSADSIPYFFFFFLIMICIVLLLRELNCWYWKINEIRDLLKSINEKLGDGNFPKTAQAYINEGDELLEKANNLSGKEAENLYKLVYEKYKAASEIDPKNTNILIDISFILLKQAKNKSEKEIEHIINEAEKILLKVEKIETGIGAYNLACLYAIRDDEEKCSLWLNKALNYNRLPDREEVLNDSDFNKMKGRDWFKEFIGKVK